MGDMLVGKRAHSLKFDDQAVVDKQVGKKFTQEGAVFIEHAQRMLRNDMEAPTAQPIGETVFINLFNVSVTQMAMQGEAGCADLIAELEDRILHHFPVLALSAPPCGQNSAAFAVRIRNSAR